MAWPSRHVWELVYSYLHYDSNDFLHKSEAQGGVNAIYMIIMARKNKDHEITPELLRDHAEEITYMWVNKTQHQGLERAVKPDYLKKRPIDAAEWKKGFTETFISRVEDYIK